MVLKLACVQVRTAADIDGLIGYGMKRAKPDRVRRENCINTGAGGHMQAAERGFGVLQPTDNHRNIALLSGHYIVLLYVAEVDKRRETLDATCRVSEHLFEAERGLS